VDGGNERESERPVSLAETLDGVARRLSMALVIGGAAIALAIYSRPGPPHYQAFETETGIVRVDTRSGTVLHCVANGCYTVVRRGQSLLDREERQKAREKAFGDDTPAVQRALPAPQPQLQPQAQPRPSDAPKAAPADAR